MSTKPNFSVVRSEVRHRGKVFDLLVDEIEYTSGNRSIREVARHPGGAVAVPMPDADSVLLIRQYRYPIGDFLYELPAGKLDAGEDPAVCAARELEEETGYKAGSLAPLTSIYTTPGFCTEQLHIFLATDLQRLPDGQRLEEGEVLSLETVPFNKALEMVDHGQIVDSKTICGLLMTERLLRRKA